MNILANLHRRLRETIENDRFSGLFREPMVGSALAAGPAAVQPLPLQIQRDMTRASTLKHVAQVGHGFHQFVGLIGQSMGSGRGPVG